MIFSLFRFKKIYTAPTEQLALMEFTNFKEKYKNNKTILKVVEQYMEYILPLFEYPQEIRKVTRGKGALANEETLMKVLYLRINDLENKRSKSVANWDIILNQLILILENRITKYLDI